MLIYKEAHGKLQRGRSASIRSDAWTKVLWICHESITRSRYRIIHSQLKRNPDAYQNVICDPVYACVPSPASFSSSVFSPVAKTSGAFAPFDALRAFRSLRDFSPWGVAALFRVSRRLVTRPPSLFTCSSCRKIHYICRRRIVRRNETSNSCEFNWKSYIATGTVTLCSTRRRSFDASRVHECPRASAKLINFSNIRTTRGGICNVEKNAQVETIFAVNVWIKTLCLNF